MGWGGVGWEDTRARRYERRLKEHDLARPGSLSSCVFFHESPSPAAPRALSLSLSLSLCVAAVYLVPYISVPPPWENSLTDRVLRFRFAFGFAGRRPLYAFTKAPTSKEAETCERNERRKRPQISMRVCARARADSRQMSRERNLFMDLEGVMDATSRGRRLVDRSNQSMPRHGSAMIPPWCSIFPSFFLSFFFGNIHGNYTKSRS